MWICDCCSELNNDKNKKCAYDSFTPLRLDSTNTLYTDGEGKYRWSGHNNAYDNLGQKYVHFCYLSNESIALQDSYSGSATYYVADFDYFTGRLLLRDFAKDVESCGSFTLYADDAIIYQSPDIGKGFMPTDLTFDISSAETITLYLSYTKSFAFGIADMMVYKDPANYPAFTERL